MSSFGFSAPVQDSIDIDAQSPWPTLSTGEFRRLRRIPEFFEEQSLADSLMRSALEIQQQLLAFAARASTVNASTQGSMGKDAPFTVATDPATGLPFAELSDQQLQVYRGAVYGRSHADLLGYFSAVDQRDAGNNKAQDHDQRQAMLGESNKAVRLLCGLGRAGVHAL